jgi:galactose mutarotase-like enzyme
MGVSSNARDARVRGFMPLSLIRIVAFILLPCLITDPTWPAVYSAIDAPPISQRSPGAGLFEQQALTASVLQFLHDILPKDKPSIRLRQWAWALAAGRLSSEAKRPMWEEEAPDNRRLLAVDGDARSGETSEELTVKDVVDLLQRMGKVNLTTSLPSDVKVGMSRAGLTQALSTVFQRVPNSLTSVPLRIIQQDDQLHIEMDLGGTGLSEMEAAAWTQELKGLLTVDTLTAENYANITPERSHFPSGLAPPYMDEARRAAEAVLRTYVVLEELLLELRSDVQAADPERIRRTLGRFRLETPPLSDQIASIEMKMEGGIPAKIIGLLGHASTRLCATVLNRSDQWSDELEGIRDTSKIDIYLDQIRRMLATYGRLAEGRRIQAGTTVLLRLPITSSLLSQGLPVTLQSPSGGSLATVQRIGAQITSLVLNGIEVFYQTGYGFGGYTVPGPWFGRLAEGRFDPAWPFLHILDGHAIHGMYPRMPWKIVQAAEDTAGRFVTLELEDPASLDRTPFNTFGIRKTYRIGEGELVIEDEVVNQSDKRQKGSFGHHVVFNTPEDEEWTLIVPGNEYVAEKVPVTDAAQAVDGTEFDYRRGAPLAGKRQDFGLSQLPPGKATAVLRNKHGREIEVTWDSQDYPYVWIWTENGHTAIEPVTGLPNLQGTSDVWPREKQTRRVTISAKSPDSDPAAPRGKTHPDSGLSDRRERRPLSIPNRFLQRLRSAA